MSDNVVLYCENLPTEGMETLIAELCPPELDLRFLYPVKNGKKGDFEDADYILASIHKIGKDEMDRAKNLKLIHVPATGYNHVDLEYAKQKGIPVCNSNGENATTTAEFTIALMLACMRRLSMIDRRCKQGEWHSWTWRHDSYELRDKVIGVVGGGPAGMNFAIYAAQRGHTVEILEKTSELGGIANAAAVPKNKYDMHNYIEWLKRQTLGQKGVAVKFGVEATPEYLKAQNYDAVIYAVGAKRISPRIPGIDTVNMVEATELLRNPEKLGGAKKVVVLGGGAVGMETAYWLSYEHGCKITVIDMLGNFMDGACTANRGHIIHYLEDNGAKLVNCATIKSFEPGRVLVSRNISKGAPDVYCTWTPVLPKNVVNPLAPKMGPETVVEEHHAELFVNALGRRADESQYLEGVKQHVAKEIYNIGDSFQAGLVWGATKAAYNLAQYI